MSATALYWHFSDKDELVNAMVEQLYLQAYQGIHEETNLQASLHRLGKQFRTSLNTCKDGAQLCATDKP
ncbi:hypothetical protein GAGA_0886 [Paraglaciecola agarilytica NO2]|uniref:HTH tetR-type domain-containing protein n=1 Tax=Paraglaciecola agarilytica NO2 TaxID=1125747 RepID=A0ABQ0I3W4_9ALTE|nr:hypothetical protein GAGA_0886 [Paraglaciecola agarilytica NO2]